MELPTNGEIRVNSNGTFEMLLNGKWLPMVHDNISYCEVEEEE